MLAIIVSDSILRGYVLINQLKKRGAPVFQSLVFEQIMIGKVFRNDVVRAGGIKSVWKNRKTRNDVTDGFYAVSFRLYLETCI